MILSIKKGLIGLRITFRGGIHPRERYGGKSLTGKLPVEAMPAPAQVAILLGQHVGAPCKCLVKAGDRVLVEVSPTYSYYIQIRSVEKGTDDDSLPISSY